MKEPFKNLLYSFHGEMGKKGNGRWIPCLTSTWAAFFFELKRFTLQIKNADCICGKHSPSPLSIVNPMDRMKVYDISHAHLVK